MNPRNPYTCRNMEMGSSVETENPTGETEDVVIEENIASSSSMIQNLIGSSANATSLERTGLLSIATSLDNNDARAVRNPVDRDYYFLENLVGSYYNRHCLVFKARNSQFSWGIRGSPPSRYVTLKIIDMKTYVNESEEIQRQTALRHDYYPHDHANVIEVHAAFSTVRGLFCVSMPYMSEGSLRYILKNRPDNRLPEYLILPVLRVVLVGLRGEIHGGLRPRAHKTLNIGDIFVHIDDVTGELSIKLAFGASVYHSEGITDLVFGQSENFSLVLDPRRIYIWGAAPEVYRNENADDNDPRPDIWLFGLTALELAYGNLPVKNREDLNYIIRKIREKNKFPKSLERLLSKRNGKFKKVMDFVKRKKRVFSVEFEEMVLACLDEDPVKRPTAAQLLNAPFFVTDIGRFKQFVTSGNNPGPAHNVAAEERIEN